MNVCESSHNCQSMIKTLSDEIEVHLVARPFSTPFVKATGEHYHIFLGVRIRNMRAWGVSLKNLMHMLSENLNLYFLHDFHVEFKLLRKKKS